MEDRGRTLREDLILEVRMDSIEGEGAGEEIGREVGGG